VQYDRYFRFDTSVGIGVKDFKTKFRILFDPELVSLTVARSETAE
jgi:hypothetical protein